MQTSVTLAGLGAGVPSPAALDLHPLEEDLRTLVLAQDDRTVALGEIVRFTAKVIDAILVSYFRREANGRLMVVAEAVGPAKVELPAEVLDRRLEWAEKACELLVPQVNFWGTGLIAISIPIEPRHARPEVLCAIFTLGATPAEQVMALVQLAAAHALLWDAEFHSRQSEWEAVTTAAIVELVSKVSHAGGLKHACHTLANEARQYLDCQRVAVGIVNRSGHCRLKAVSGMAELDRRSDLAESIEAALEESVLRKATAVWPPVDDAERHAAMAHGKLSQLSSGCGLLSAPLRDVDGRVVGAWVFLGSEEFVQDPDNRRFVEACAQPVGTCLATLQSGEHPRLLRAVAKGLREKPIFKSKWFAAAMCALLATFFLPWPYKISCNCVVEPVTRRFVAAPFAGTFEKSLVQPGDLVAQNQVLGRMDGRDIRWELAGLIAEQSRAEKSRDVNMATSKEAAAQMDRLEMERLDLKRRVLEHRAENLEIKSPIGGIVIAGDLERSEGVPLTIGQSLFEVAPLDHMVAEVEVPDDEVTHVREGQSVTIRLDSQPGTRWTGTLTKVHPRAEIRETANVFVAEVLLENPDHVLRPGMKGSAKITADRHPLFWIFLHKPWNYVSSWLGW